MADVPSFDAGSGGRLRGHPVTRSAWLAAVLLLGALALVFAVHPISAFATVYISNRGFLWMTVGYYAALACYVAGWRSPRPGMAQSNARPVLAGALAYVLAQLRVQLSVYLPAFLWPAPIRREPAAPNPSWTDPWALAAGAACAALVVLAVRLRRSHPEFTLAVLACPVTIVPTTLLAQPIPVSFYRPYPGSPFLYLAVLWPLRHRLATRAALVVLAILSVASDRVCFQQRTLADPWLHSVEYGALPRAQYYLATQIQDPDARRAALERVVERGPGPGAPAARALRPGPSPAGRGPGRPPAGRGRP